MLLSLVVSLHREETRRTRPFLQIPWQIKHLRFSKYHRTMVWKSFVR